MIKWLDDHAGILSAVAIALTVAFGGFDLYFDRLGPADVSVAIGEVVQLNRKPYVGLNTTLRNSGAREAVITRGTLTFGGTSMTLVMQSIEQATWTYSDPPQNTPPRFTFFAPLILGKGEVATVTVWFEVGTNNPEFFSPGLHPLVLRLYGRQTEQPVASAQFAVNLTTDDVTNIYLAGRELDTLPVSVASETARSIDAVK